MCQAKPGLRCSFHAEQKVAYYEDKVQEKKSLLSAGNHSPNEEQRIRRSLEGFVSKLEYSQHEYLMTPMGERKAKDKLKEMEPGKERDKLKENLRHAIKVKNRRKFAMRHVFEPSYNHRITEGNLDIDTIAEADAAVKDYENRGKFLRQYLQDFMETSGNRMRIQSLAEKIGETSAMIKSAKDRKVYLEQSERDSFHPLRNDPSFEGYLDGVSYDYDTRNNCYESGCEDEGICRCGQIVRSWITSVDTDKVLREVSGRNSVPQELVEFANSIGFDDPINWEVKTAPGYYGEEVRGVMMDNRYVSEKLIDFIDEWNRANR